MLIDFKKSLLAILFFSQVCFAGDPTQQYPFYWDKLFQNHFRGGLLATRHHCPGPDSRYAPCPDAYEGYVYPDSTYYLGWLLSVLAKDYSLQIHPRAESLSKIKEILDTYDRLSKYSTLESLQKARDLFQQGTGTAYEKFLIRQEAVKSWPTSGYLIRHDMDEEFEKHILQPDVPSDVDPSLDQYTGILFGLVNVARLVDDPSIRSQIRSLAGRMRSYLIENDFELKRPWDQKVVKRGPDVWNFRYPFLLALNWLTGQKSTSWPELYNKAMDLRSWTLTLKGLARSARVRCSEESRLKRRFKWACNYYNHPLVYINSAFLALESEPQALSNHIELFKTVYIKSGFLKFDLNPMLALIAREYYFVSDPDVEEAFSQMDSEPTHQLPNTWDSPGLQLTHPGKNYFRDKNPRPSPMPGFLGTEYSGIDYLLSQIYRGKL